VFLAKNKLKELHSVALNCPVRSGWNFTKQIHRRTTVWWYEKL